MAIALVVSWDGAGALADDGDWRGIGPRLARDINRDPDVVEVNLTADVRAINLLRRGGDDDDSGDDDNGRRGKVTMWTYNGQVPGPTIVGKVGDTLIVNFVNRLPRPTTVHWHGLEVPAVMDGSNISQAPVPPGGEFRYEFKLKDAATYWFHSHIETNEQVEMGLHGALVVRDPATDVALRLPEREHVLVLDDILIDDRGQVAEPFPEDPLDNARTHLNGRFGNHLLVNGRVSPTHNLRRGVPHRLCLVNVSNSRFMRVSIPGHTLYRIGGDGGLLESPVAVPPIEMIPDPADPSREISNPDPAQGLVLTPGERADVVFTPHGRHRLRVEWHDQPRGSHAIFRQPDGGIGIGNDPEDGKAPPQTLMTFRLTGRDSERSYIPPPFLRDIDRIDLAGAEKIVLEFGHAPPDANGKVVFFAQRKNGMGLPFWMVTAEDAPEVTVGETRIIEVHNLTRGDHNFHLHGFFVQPIETQFVDLDTPGNNFVVPAERLEVKDTIRIPRRPGAGMRSRTITRLAVVFDDSGRGGDVVAFGKDPSKAPSGGWVMHCHILEHADNGMMSFVQVLDP